MIVAPMVAVDMVTMVRQMVCHWRDAFACWLVVMTVYLTHFITAHTLAGGMAFMASPPRAKPRP